MIWLDCVTTRYRKASERWRQKRKATFPGDTIPPGWSTVSAAFCPKLPPDIAAFWATA
jgi:hypothetical protein